MRGRKEVDVVRARERIEFDFEHAHDVVVVVADDAPRRDVPQHRNRDAAAVGRVGRRVRFGQEAEAVDRVGAMAGGVAKRPAALVANRVDHGHADRAFESF